MKYRWLLGILAFVTVLPPVSTAADGNGPRDFSQTVRKQIERADIDWLRDATQKQLRGCRVQGKDGVWLHTPDGVGNYRALWTRDFTYMVEYAGDLLEPKEIKASILYLLTGQRDDGCMPDRVNVAGKGVFSPGPEQKPMADHALDNGAFMAELVCAYVDLTGDLDLPRQVEPAIRKGLDYTHRAANGLIDNPPATPQCPYGFTDTVAKTGHLLFCSVLYYDACVRMERLCRQAQCGDPAEYRCRAELICKNLGLLWNEDAGMFWAADRDCKQIDIWGSALAAHLGLTTETQSGRIADYLVKHYDEIVQRGQVRHLPAGETWQRFFRKPGVKPGTYQNGAFWATPVAWVAPTIARRNPDLAVKMVRDVIADFRARGITECVNGHYHNVSEYVVSATNVYGLVKEPAAGNGQSIQHFTVTRNDKFHESWPDLALAANGDFVLTYQESESHGGGGVSTIVTRVSQDRGRTWGKRTVVAQLTHRQRDGWLNSSRIVRLQDQSLLMTVDWVPQNPPPNSPHVWGDIRAVIWLYSSRDNGRSWVGPEKTSIRGGIVPGITQLRDGTLLIGTTRFEPDNHYRQIQLVHRSTDNGKTWKGPMIVGKHPKRQPNEGDFVELATGEVVCYMRDDEPGVKNGLRSISRDGGQTWSPLYRSGPWNYSGHPKVGLLSTGEIFLTSRVGAPLALPDNQQPGHYLGAYMESQAAALQPTPLKGPVPKEARWVLIDNDTNRKRPDWGYSSWLELPDGSIYVVQYITTADAPATKPFIRGYRVPRSVLQKGSPKP